MRVLPSWSALALPLLRLLRELRLSALPPPGLFKHVLFQDTTFYVNLSTSELVRCGSGIRPWSQRWSDSTTSACSSAAHHAFCSLHLIPSTSRAI